MIDDKKLEEMYQMVLDNNRMLREMRRAAFVGNIIRIVWWVFILIILPYLSWLFIQPYLEAFQSTREGISSTSASATQQVQDLLKGLGL